MPQPVCELGCPNSLICGMGIGIMFAIYEVMKESVPLSSKVSRPEYQGANEIPETGRACFSHSERHGVNIGAQNFSLLPLQEST